MASKGGARNKNYNGENYHTITFYARLDNRINDIPDNIVNNAQTEKKYDGVIFLNIQDSKSPYNEFDFPIANNYYAFNNNQIHSIHKFEVLNKCNLQTNILFYL